MVYKKVISTDESLIRLNDSTWLFFDCRYYLEKPQQGHKEYSQAHLPGAIYADLGEDLSAPVVTGVTGRHPLPDIKEFSQRLSKWGVDESVQVVVYDQGPGMIAARLWWMLRWLGHENVAVMEGGWKKWLKENKPVSSESVAPKSRQFTANVRPELVAEVEDVRAAMHDPNVKLLDARAAERFRGENETLDPVAGHIPGAVSAPFISLVDENGCLRSVKTLRSMNAELLGDVSSSRAIVYCGSGVTAALNILAMEHAGLGMARLYPGSWSHWITDPNRPVATGDN